jgi:hypothetical protein
MDIKQQNSGQKLNVKCFYSNSSNNPAQIIQSSFEKFINRQIKNVNFDNLETSANKHN